MSYLKAYAQTYAARHPMTRATPPFPARDLPDGQISHLAVQPRLQKYSASPPTQINSKSSAIPSRTEGRFAIVTDVGHGMRWTRQRQARE